MANLEIVMDERTVELAVISGAQQSDITSVVNAHAALATGVHGVGASIVDSAAARDAAINAHNASALAHGLTANIKAALTGAASPSAANVLITNSAMTTATSILVPISTLKILGILSPDNYSIDFSLFKDGRLPAPWDGGTYTISSGKAINTPALGTEMVTNGGFAADTDWTKGTGWTIAGGVASINSVGTAALAQNISMVANVWYRCSYTVQNRTSGQVVLLFGSDNGFTIDRAANGTYIETSRRAATGNGAISIYSDGGAVLDVDNVSVKPISVLQSLALLPSLVYDVEVKAACIATGFSPVGVALNWDSRSNPQNGVIGYITGNNQVRLEKCVAGIWTTLIALGVTYGSGKVIRIVKSGTSYSLYYGTAGSEVQVGTTQTISDAGIINNTLHGMFATEGAQLQSFFLIV